MKRIGRENPSGVAPRGFNSVPRPPRKGFVGTDGVAEENTNIQAKKTRPARTKGLTRSSSFGMSWGGKSGGGSAGGGGDGSSGGVGVAGRGKAPGVDTDGKEGGVGDGLPPPGKKINGAAPSAVNGPSPPSVNGSSNNNNKDATPVRHRKKLSRVPLFASSSLPSSPSSSPRGGGGGGGEIGFGWGKKLGVRRSSAADASPGRRGFGRGIGGGGGRGREGGRGGNAAAAASGLRPGDDGEGEEIKYTKSMAHALAFAPDDDDVSACTEDRHDSERHSHPHEVGLIDFDEEQRSGISMVTPSPSYLSVGSVWSRHSALTADSTTRSEVGVEEMEVGKRDLDLVGHSCDGDSITDREIFEGLGLGEEDENQEPGEKMDGASAQAGEGVPPRYSPLLPPPYSASAAASQSARPMSIDVCDSSKDRQ